jgi:hypothetical protein
LDSSPSDSDPSTDHSAARLLRVPRPLASPRSPSPHWSERSSLSLSSLDSPPACWSRRALLLTLKSPSLTDFPPPVSLCAPVTRAAARAARPLGSGLLLAATLLRFVSANLAAVASTSALLSLSIRNAKALLCSRASSGPPIRPSPSPWAPSCVGPPQILPGTAPAVALRALDATRLA